MRQVGKRCLTYIRQYGFLHGLWRLYAKLRSPVFRPLFLARFVRLMCGETRCDASLPLETCSPFTVFSKTVSPLADIDFSTADTLVLDNNVGGGAKVFCNRYCASLENEGKSVLLVRFNHQSLCYDVLLRGEGSSRAAVVKTSSELYSLLSRNLPRSVFYNSIFSWPDPLSAVRWLKWTASRTELSIYLHDFFCLCPAVVLLDPTFRFCGLPQERHCNACLCRNLLAAPYTPLRIGPWREAWGAALVSASTLWGPHESMRNLLVQVYPEIRARFEVFSTPGLPVLQKKRMPDPAPPEKSITIGVIGTIDIHKGALIVADLVKLLEQQSGKFRLVVIGELLVPVKSSCLVVTGRYQREDLPELMARHKVSVGLVPSVCPETYCYTVDEFIQLGVPVVSFAIGAQGWKTRRYASGVCAETISAESCLQAVRRVVNE